MAHSLTSPIVLTLSAPQIAFMDSSSLFHFMFAIILLLNSIQGIGGEIVYEQGYAVTTVIDGNKLQINPYSVSNMYGSSSDLVVLDHVQSTFYTVSFSDSQGNNPRSHIDEVGKVDVDSLVPILVSEIKKLSGNGDAGYEDGDLGSAMFNKPKNFALDRKNNIYIADIKNHVIRKISKSVVTTIAGGYVQETGKTDGPAQNASFSNNFELAFDPQRCALLIADRGNSLVRQLDLKADDCAASSSGSGLGSTTAWGIGVGVACLIGLVIGFAIRPYVLPHEASGHPRFSMTWKHCLINLGKQAVTFYSVNRNAIVSFKLYDLLKKLVRLFLSQLSLVFGLNMIRPQHTPPPMKFVSLLDSDCFGNHDHETTKTQNSGSELKDLITFDGTLNSKQCLDQENAYRLEGFPETGEKINRHIYANLVGFVEGSKRSSSVESWEICS